MIAVIKICLIVFFKNTIFIVRLLVYIQILSFNKNRMKTEILMKTNNDYINNT